jgi:hypothetical protein
MNWWQFGLLIIGLLALSWVLVSVTFGMMLMAVAGNAAAEIEGAKAAQEQKP